MNIFHNPFRQWSEEVNLMKGFRYELNAYYYGNGISPEFFRLGVEFPDKSEEKPISKNYLWRSMGNKHTLLLFTHARVIFERTATIYRAR